MKRSDNIKRLKALGKELSAKPKVSGKGKKAKAEKPKPAPEPMMEELKLEEKDETEVLMKSTEED